MGHEQPFEYPPWSYSAATVFDSCPRRFYYRHLPTEATTTGTKTGNQSPVFHSLGALIGVVVHECIAQKIDRWRIGESLSYQAAETMTSKKLEEYILANTESLAQIDTKTHEEKAVAEVIERGKSVAHSHLDCFYRIIWPQFTAHQYLLHEAYRSFKIDGSPVAVRPDLCTRDSEENFVVTDWKTSDSDPLSAPSLQQLVYALWAYEEYEPEIERIIVQLVHTKNGEFDCSRFGPEDLVAIRERIQSDRQEWREAETIADYQPCPELAKCSSCPYVTRCHAGQQVLTE
ncbi:PD-(D/E)XK nuclease family protein [Haloarcula nitratireducens]|uniref:PD-(D/E)XK nuclease family protein n=1 Tax=Haloarcula nitratireducens TaxID=2487749 RepID=A0AAW4PJJ1_9EURY|nr:PD-(D/E)XK nuclease family protein [Halomicroarcula nitratireducens]MBX0297535.1 PD-(D/E)XK nuclease family protein [Halomicroarcula nitratireducens]